MLHLNPQHSWHWGFAAAGVGMICGLIQYVWSGDRLKGIGLRPRKTVEPAEGEEKGADFVSVILAVLGCAVGLISSYIYFQGIHFSTSMFPTFVGGAIGYLIGVLRQLRGEELRRVLVIFILCAFSVIFWMSFEQSAGSLTLFADRLTRNSVLGFTYPSSWYQAIQPLFVILLAPLFAGLWVHLGRRQPSSPTKFSFGLLFAGLAFGVMAIAAIFTRAGKVSPLWLVACYLLQTFGELCLSPVGLSTVTKLSPARLVGLMMGVWFLFTSFGEFIAGLSMKYLNPDDQVKLFAVVSGITLVAAAVLFVLTPVIKKMVPPQVVE